MHKQPDNGYIFNNIDRFDKQTTDAFITRIKAQLAAVKEKSISALNATQKALVIEASLADGCFYEIVTSDAPEFKAVADYLTKATNTPIELIPKQLKEQRVK